MPEAIRVELHCHSSCSDGFYAPRQVAALLAGSRVRYAALTDHDTTEGLKEFEEACSRNSVATITGLEISVGDDRDLLHLLAFGFDPANPALQERLARTRALRGGEGAPATSPREDGQPGGLSVTPDEAGSRGWLKELAGAIEVVHQAHGRAFLAHPLALSQDPETLDKLLELARGVGLDGVEAYYQRHSDVESRTLADLAVKHGLLVCGGTDFHGPEQGGPLRPGLDLPANHWKAFRDALIATAPLKPQQPRPELQRSPGMQAGGFVLRILVPSLVAMALFITSIFAVIIPETEQQLLDRKRELIRELTRSAWSVLAEYHNLEKSGRASREEAQREARERVKGMRYGADQKDYFWITDQRPRMIMHPYRTDLDGQDLSGFADPNGVRLFVEFANKVRESREGYTQYVWQWKDDPSRLVAKESFVMGFEPWGWIIGTGIYVEDVRAEIDRLASRVVDISAMIAIPIVLLLLVILQQSLKIERRRRRIAADLDESHEKYRALVEAATEGTLLVLEGQCSFANNVILERLGYSAAELALLEVTDLVLAAETRGGQTPDHLDALLRGEEVQAPFEARLRGKDGSLHHAVLSASTVTFAGRPGFILNVRDTGTDKQMEEALDVTRQRYHALTGTLDLGVFHADMREGGVLVDLNPAGRRILGIAPEGDLPARRLLDYFRDHDEGVNFARSLRQDGRVSRLAIWLTREDGEHVLVSLSASLGRYGFEGREYCDGVIEDITSRARAAEDRDTLIAELQTSLLFLNEPLRHFLGALHTCAWAEPIAAVGARMTRERCSAMAVTGDGGVVLGVVTDHDFRERVLVAELDPARPVHEIMSAPVVSISQRALVYEAVLLMQDRGIRHLAVRDEQERIVGMVRSKDLIRFERYSASVLSHQLRKARSVDELSVAHRRLPVLVKGLLDGGTNTRIVTRIITNVSDATVNRLIDLATARLGPPPVPFAFLALGSEGRGEQTLVTDQDNALVYLDPSPEAAPAAQAWFRELAVAVCDGLNQAGYAWCRGDLMAKNPRWCQPLSAWKQLTARWISNFTPQDLLDVNKFFDFRAVHGEVALGEALRDHVAPLVTADSAFFKFLAESSTKGGPPVGIFGQVVAGSGRARAGAIDLKSPLMLITNFARLYAVLHGVRVVNTAERLQRLHELGVTSNATHNETLQAYDFLLRLRLAHQARAVSEEREPGNEVDPRQLTAIEQRMLKQIFAQITGLQSRIAHDFGLAE
jgi:PAS domain S-box-containing protein